GSVRFGKNILETLNKRFKDEKLRWILTQEEDSIKQERGIYRIRTSLRLLDRMNNELYDRNRDIKNDIIRSQFSIVYPGFFDSEVAPVYVPGQLSGILNKEIVPRLSSEDRQAMLDFLPDFISSESLSSVNLLKAETEIESLKDLAKDLETAIEYTHAESWWQKYIRKNILIIQQGYIKAIEKMNVSVGNVKFPDFSLVTHDNYLDIFEIKKPSTDLIKRDPSRGNYYWDVEMSKAITQVENYIENVSKHADAVRSYLKDEHKIDLKVVKPRGIILAGNTQKFNIQKEKDDFRLLSQGLKNITIVTYDELLVRLQNYIKVLESFKRTKKHGK
ncbi:MAG: Shedu immune nuclease family protein, partial [Minisyncoccota bacterium]